MEKYFVGILLFSSVVFSSPKTFFFLPPYTETWFNSTPVVVENGDKTRPLAMSADTLGWVRYTWDGDSLPDSVSVYKDSDSLFLEPIGFFGYPAETIRGIPMKTLFCDVFSYRDSLFFIPEKSFRIGEQDLNEGFYTEDVRKDQGFFLREEDFTLFVLVPDYPDWIDETPVIVDAKDSGDFWEMEPENSEFSGWFRYTWAKGGYLPEEFWIYKKSDATRNSPIGANGFALGRTDLVPFELEDVDSLFLVPDLNYRCYSKGDEIYGDPGIVYLKDIRKNCPLKKLCLEKDFEPACHDIDFNSYPVYYSIYSEDSVLVKDEKLLLPGYDCVFGGSNPGCANRFFFESSLCQLEAGDYLVKIRDEVSDSAFFMPYTIETSKIFAGAPSRNVQIRVEGATVFLDVVSPTDFTVFSALGAVVLRGRVEKNAALEIPQKGNFLLRTDTKTFRVQIK